MKENNAVLENQRAGSANKSSGKKGETSSHGSGRKLQDDEAGDWKVQVTQNNERFWDSFNCDFTQKMSSLGEE